MLSSAESPSYFPLIWDEVENLQNCCRKLQIIKQENYKNLLLKFLRKSVGGSLVSARPLCSVDDVSDRSSNATAWNSFSPTSRDSLREEDLRVLAP